MSPPYRYIFYLTITLLFSYPVYIHSSDNSDCNIDTKPGNVFINPELLKNTKVFSDFSDAPPCPKKSCDTSDCCSIQLRNTSVSNMIPCCVQLVSSQKSVCQCVIALPDKHGHLTECPPSDLKLVSNQIFIMSGVSNFFTVPVPICGSLRSFFNIYKGTGTKIRSAAEPFRTKGKSGFTFTTAYNKDGWYIYFYSEFVTTCKTSISFNSDDLPFCKQETCNVDLPYVSIVLDLNNADLTNDMNAVFRNLDTQNECEATVLSNNQCPAMTENRCDPKTQPCCYSKRCIFPYIFVKNPCPCPPKDSDLFYANNIPLGCSLAVRIHAFNQMSNPLVTQGFIWDLQPEPLQISFNRLLTGRITIQSTVINANVTLVAFGEFTLDICVFAECLREVLKNKGLIEVPEFIIRLLTTCR